MRTSGSVSQVGGQGGREERETVDGHKSPLEHGGELVGSESVLFQYSLFAPTHYPNLPVQKGILDKLVLERLRTAIIVERKSRLHEVSLFGA